MDYLQVLGAAITFGSALGATLASLFAVRQKSLVTLLRESNDDYAKRVTQLEGDRDNLEKTVSKQADEITKLKNEKVLPLKQLTELVIKQHSQTNKSIMELIRALDKKDTRK